MDPENRQLEKEAYSQDLADSVLQGLFLFAIIHLGRTQCYGKELLYVCCSKDTNAQSPIPCGPLPRTLVRIFIPPGAVINLLNLIEVASPSGVCLIMVFD